MINVETVYLNLGTVVATGEPVVTVSVGHAIVGINPVMAREMAGTLIELAERIEAITDGGHRVHTITSQ